MTLIISRRVIFFRHFSRENFLHRNMLRTIFFGTLKDREESVNDFNYHPIVANKRFYYEPCPNPSFETMGKQSYCVTFVSVFNV